MTYVHPGPDVCEHHYRPDLCPHCLRDLLRELVDPDPCQYDHNGLCQAHRLDRAPCPHERAKALLGDDRVRAGA